MKNCNQYGVITYLNKLLDLLKKYFVYVQHHALAFKTIILGEKTGLTLVKTNRENLYGAFLYLIF